MTRRMTRRELLRVAGLGSMVALLAACQPRVVEKVVEKEVTKIIKEVVKETIIVEGTPQVVEKEVTRIIEVTKAPELKDWVIGMAAAGLNPTDPKATLAEGEVPIEGLAPAAEDYHDLYPNVTLEWYRLPEGVGQDEWLQARMAAQDAPDIWKFNADSLWPHIHKGWALDMTEWLNTPNPYMPGKRPWVSYIDDVGRLSEIGPDGKTYGICLDGAGVMIIYNKDAFADAGITQEPETWTEFEEVWQKLKDKDYIPFGGDMPHINCCFAHWTHGHVWSQLAGDRVFDYDDDNNRMVTAQEMVMHAQKGDWPLWEYFLGVAQFLKRQEPFLPMGYAGQLDYRGMFRRGEVVMYMEGNWQVVGFTKDPPPFEYGWLFYPKITRDLWPGVKETKIRLQGPWGGSDFHVTGYLPETDPERLPVIMDWLMFITQAKYVTAFCGERGTVPFVEGSTPPPEIEPFMRPYDDIVVYQSWGILSASALNRQIELQTEYMAGGLSDDELLAKAKEVYADEVRKSLENNPDWKI